MDARTDFIKHGLRARHVLLQLPLANTLAQTTRQIMEACGNATATIQAQLGSGAGHGGEADEVLSRSAVIISLLAIPVIGSIARGTQRLNCSMRGSMERALSNSAVECRMLWNQLPEVVKD